MMDVELHQEWQDETDLEFILRQSPYDWQMDSELTTLIGGSPEDFVDCIAFLLNNFVKCLLIIQPMNFKPNIEEKDNSD